MFQSIANRRLYYYSCSIRPFGCHIRYVLVYESIYRPRSDLGQTLQMEYHQYYEGVFSDQELDYKDRWLVVCIEAAWYCESNGVKYIRFSQLKSRCSNLIKRSSKRTPTLSSSTLNSVLKSGRVKGLLKKRKRVGPKKNQTRIYPNIRRIQKVVQDRKSENLTLKDSKLLWYRGPGDIVTKVRSPPRESVTISDRVDRIVTRGPNTLLLLMIQSSPCALPGP
jgi:hypothetical protein